MEFISGLILGAVIGAVLGVAADRIWARVERKPRFRVHGGPYWRRGNQQGIQISVENIGGTEIPPFGLWLFNPLAGSFSIFELRSGPAALLPTQEVQFELALIQNGCPIPHHVDLFKRGDNLPMSEADKDQYSFRLVMENSHLVLYENERIGRSLARSIMAVISQRDIKAIGNADWLWPHENAIRPLHRLKEWRENRRIIRQAKNRQRSVTPGQHPDSKVE